MFAFFKYIELFYLKRLKKKTDSSRYDLFKINVWKSPNDSC